MRTTCVQLPHCCRHGTRMHLADTRNCSCACSEVSKVSCSSILSAPCADNRCVPCCCHPHYHTTIYPPQVMMTLGKALEIEADAAQRSSYWLVLSKQRSTDLVNGELCLGFEMMYMDQQQHSQVRFVLPAQHVVNVCVCVCAHLRQYLGRLPSRWPVLPYPAQLRELDRLWHVAVDSRLATSAPPQAS